MEIQLLVERGMDLAPVKIAGTVYNFKRNVRGHLVADITDEGHLKWVCNPHNSSFQPYVVGTVDNLEVVDGKVQGEATSEEPNKMESGETSLDEPLKIQPARPSGIPEVEKYGQRIKKPLEEEMQNGS